MKQAIVKVTVTFLCLEDEVVEAEDMMRFAFDEMEPLGYGCLVTHQPATAVPKAAHDYFNEMTWGEE